MARLLVLVSATIAALHAYTPAPSLENTGKPIRVPFVCDANSLDTLGLTCTQDEPCPMYLELSAADAAGERVFIAGNIHTSAATVESILLGSSDRGKTWAEPYDRVRFAALDQIQFVDGESGWISGAVIQPLPRDPFFLLTTDGGKTWRQRPVFEEMHQGGIDRFWFESPKKGLLFLTPVGGTYETYESQTGGENWVLKQSSSKPLALERSRPAGDRNWRVRADARTHSYHVEIKESSGWQRVASFLVDVGACK